MFGPVTEEFQHALLEGWVDSKVPGSLENVDGSEGGQFTRYNIRVPERFLTSFFASRIDNQPAYGDRSSSNPADFFKYFTNTDQFHGGPAYNLLNLQVDLGAFAGNWAVNESLGFTGPVPPAIEEFLRVNAVPVDVLTDIVDWAGGNLLEFFTGKNCTLFDAPEPFQVFIAVYNHMATFDDRVRTYARKAEVARANWLLLSECTSQNLARIEGPDYDAENHAYYRDACTVLADNAENGIWADNAFDGHGLVRGDVTDQAWLDQTIAHFRGEFSSVIHSLANDVGNGIPQAYGDLHPELPQLREFLFTEAVSTAYEPRNRHRSLIGNLVRQVEYLLGAGFMIDDFRNMMLGSEFGPIFEQFCDTARDPATRACLEDALRVGALAYETAGLGLCAAEYHNCRSQGLAECKFAVCSAVCDAATFGVLGDPCDTACRAGTEQQCRDQVIAHCPFPFSCLVQGCDPPDVLGVDAGCIPTGVGCVGTEIVGGEECCFYGELNPLCDSLADDICAIPDAADCTSFFSLECEEELALECTPARIEGIVNNLFGTIDYGATVVDPFIQVCDLIQEPAEFFKNIVDDNRAAIYDFVQANSGLLALAGGGMSFWAYVQDAWKESSPDAKINAAFVNNDVAASPAYRAALRQRAEMIRAQRVAAGADPAQIAGLTDFITALDSGSDLVIELDTSDPTSSWLDAVSVTQHNASEANKLEAILETDVFENITGPTLATLKRDMGSDIVETFDPFFNTVNGMKLIPMNDHDDIERVFSQVGISDPPLPWSGSINPINPEPFPPYSLACRLSDRTNLYCDVLVSNDDPSCMHCTPAQESDYGWTVDRGLIAFNENGGFWNTDHVTTFFPFATSDEAYERIYKRIFRTPSEERCAPDAPFAMPLPAFTGAMDADGLSFSEDGLRAFVSSKASGNYDIYEATRDSLDLPFSSLTPVAIASTPRDERAPFLSDEGDLFFHKANPGYLDLALAQSLGAGFESPQMLTGINSGVHDQDPFFLSLTQELFFSSERPSGAQRDIYVSVLSQNGFEAPAMLSVVSSPFSEDTRPVLSRDGLTLYFGSTRTGIGGDTQGDIFFATRTGLDEPFSEPVNMLPLNSAGVDFPVALSPDGCTLFLASNREGGTAASTFRLYQAQRGTHTPARVTVQLNIIGDGNVFAPPLDCSTGTQGACSVEGAPGSTMMIAADRPALWTGTCTGHNGTISTDAVLVFTDNGTCSVSF